MVSGGCLSTTQHPNGLGEGFPHHPAPPPPPRRIPRTLKTLGQIFASMPSAQVIHVAACFVLCTAFLVLPITVRISSEHWIFSGRALTQGMPNTKPVQCSAQEHGEGFSSARGGGAGSDLRDPATQIFGKPTDQQISHPWGPPIHPNTIGKMPYHRQNALTSASGAHPKSPTMAHPTGGGGGVGNSPTQKCAQPPPPL